MAEDEAKARGEAGADESPDTLAAIVRRNQELEARYGGEESHGREKPLSMWERIKQAITTLAATGPTR